MIKVFQKGDYMQEPHAKVSKIISVLLKLHKHRNENFQILCFLSIIFASYLSMKLEFFVGRPLACSIVYCFLYSRPIS